MRLSHRAVFAASVALVLGTIASATGQVDNVVTIVGEANATAEKAIGAFGYDPTTNTMYVTSFGATAPFAEASFRKIENVDGVQNSIPMLSEGQVQLYYRDGDPDRSVTNPTVSGLLLNPLQIGSGGGAIPAYSTAVIVDIATTRFPSSTTTDPAATKRLYRWNLQSPPPASPTPPPYGDGRDVFTTMVTLAHLQSAAGTTSNTNNMGRQFAYSGDGQSAYALDTSTEFGGLWKIDLVTNSPSRLAAFNDANTEPAVLRTGGVDTILFRGGGTLTTNNIGGIDKITYDGTTVGPRTAHVTAAEISAFMEITNDTTITSFSMTSDSEGNLYFNNTDTAAIGAPVTGRRGIYRLDPQGRMVKVIGYEERKVAFGALANNGNPNSNTLRMQVRTATFGEGSASFSVPQVMYIETSGVNAVAGAYVFKTGDFNRDNTVDGSDIDEFKSSLTLRGVTLSADDPADHELFRFDLNGNNEVTWKDVKVLQQFYGFFDGDADINKVVDIGDFATLAANFNVTGKKWTEGDFDGNEIVDIGDFAALAANFNRVFPSELPRGSSVPEPMSGFLAAAVLLGMSRRHP